MVCIDYMQKVYRRKDKMSKKWKWFDGKIYKLYRKSASPSIIKDEKKRLKKNGWKVRVVWEKEKKYRGGWGYLYARR